MRNLLWTLIFASSYSLAGSYDQYFRGLERDFFLRKIERPYILEQHVRVAEFKKLDEILSPDAAATYNDKLNVIKINKKLIFAGSIKDPMEINNSAEVGTIFHEIGHAELDVFIEEEVDQSDISIMSYFNSNLKNFYRSHFPGFSPLGLLHEHFGYYRGDLIDFFSNEISDLYMNNGFNKFRGTCFLNPLLRKKLSEGISREEFRSIFVISSAPDFYRKKISPDYIYLKGKDVHLKAPGIPQGPVKMIELLFWSYHQDHYGFPINQIDLVKRMNKKHPYKRTLATCRDKLWDNWHAN